MMDCFRKIFSRFLQAQIAVKKMIHTTADSSSSSSSSIVVVAEHLYGLIKTRVTMRPGNS